MPKTFTGIITDEEHKKATEYNLEKLLFGKYVRSYRLIILLLWTVGGGLEYLSFQTIETPSSFLSIAKFFLGFVAIETILSLPISIY